MQTPKLPKAKGYRYTRCNSGNLCSTCQFQSMCTGCIGDKCLQRECRAAMCGSCGGSEIEERWQSSTVPAICVRSPYSELLLNQVQRESFEFTPQSRIVLSQPNVILINGRTPYNAFADETEAVMVCLRHVWSAKHGWFSQDLRDYLSVPDRVKLILSTSMQDKYLERAWEAEVYYEDFRKLGFDYWQPLAFSPYNERSRTDNFWAFYRTCFCLEACNGHFAPGFGPVSSQSWESAPWVQALSVIPNLVISWQRMTWNSSDHIRMVASDIRQIKQWQAQTGIRLSIWVLGVVNLRMVRVLKKHLGADNDLYFMSSAPWFFAMRGVLYGGLEKSRKTTDYSKSELILINQRNYATLIKNLLNTEEGSHGETSRV